MNDQILDVKEMFIRYGYVTAGIKTQKGNNLTNRGYTFVWIKVINEKLNYQQTIDYVNKLNIERPVIAARLPTVEDLIHIHEKKWGYRLKEKTVWSNSINGDKVDCFDFKSGKLVTCSLEEINHVALVDYEIID